MVSTASSLKCVKALRVLPPEQFRKPMLDCFDCLFGSNQSSFCAFYAEECPKNRLQDQTLLDEQ